MTPLEIVEKGFEWGQYQHRGEIQPFTEWMYERQPLRIIEIGSYQGGTTALFSCLASMQMISVDLPDGPFGGIGWDRARARNAKLASEFQTFVGILGNSRDSSSIEAVRTLLDGAKVDLLFIDADHSYEGVKADFANYSQFVLPGGVVAFHDINDTEIHTREGVEVRRFWRELTDGHNWHDDWPPGQEVKEYSVNGPWGGIGAIVLP